jgi:hypothetical protein
VLDVIFIGAAVALAALTALLIGLCDRLAHRREDRS